MGCHYPMREGSGMVEFSKKYPSPVFRRGYRRTAYGHLCHRWLRRLAAAQPVVAIYSTFLQRAYRPVIHDVAIQAAAVLPAIDRARIVGADGQTHQGAFDISFLRCIPDMVIADAKRREQNVARCSIPAITTTTARVRVSRVAPVPVLPLNRWHRCLSVKAWLETQRRGRSCIPTSARCCRGLAKVAEKLNATPGGYAL